MGLGSLVRSAVATAHRVTNATDGLQSTVSWTPWVGNTSSGTDAFTYPQDLTAIVEYLAGSHVRTPEGQVLSAKVRLTILSLPDAISVAGDDRHGLIDPRDTFTLPDDTTYPIVAVSGVVDPDTAYPYACEVWLG